MVFIFVSRWKCIANELIIAVIGDSYLKSTIISIVGNSIELHQLKDNRLRIGNFWRTPFLDGKTYTFVARVVFNCEKRIEDVNGYDECDIMITESHKRLTYLLDKIKLAEDIELFSDIKHDFIDEYPYCKYIRIYKDKIDSQSINITRYTINTHGLDDSFIVACVNEGLIMRYTPDKPNMDITHMMIELSVLWSQANVSLNRGDTSILKLSVNNIELSQLFDDLLLITDDTDPEILYGFHRRFMHVAEKIYNLLIQFVPYIDNFDGIPIAKKLIKSART